MTRKKADGILYKTGLYKELGTTNTTIKKDLLTKGLYHYDKYTSMDVYHAVLTENITTTQAFLETNPLTTH